MSEEQLRAVTPKKREQGKNLTTAEKNAAQNMFLEVFSERGNVLLACKAAGITRTTLYRWKEKPQFLKLYEASLEDAKDNIKAEIYRRGHDGVDEPLLNMGKPVYDDDGKIMMVKKYSDSLLMFHAKMLMPEYRDRQKVEHSGPNGGPIESSFKVHVFYPEDKEDEGK
jgi:hypothetical protein